MRGVRGGPGIVGNASVSDPGSGSSPASVRFLREDGGGAGTVSTDATPLRGGNGVVARSASSEGGAGMVIRSWEAFASQSARISDWSDVSSDEVSSARRAGATGFIRKSDYHTRRPVAPLDTRETHG